MNHGVDELVNVPSIKKKLNAFIYGEQGRVSKAKVAGAGAVIGLIAALKSIDASSCVPGGCHGSCHSSHSSHNQCIADCSSVGGCSNGAHGNYLSLTSNSNNIKGSHNSCKESHSNY